MNKIVRVISIVMISAFLSLLFFSSVSFAKEANNKYDWYQWRGPNRDGVSSEKDWLATWTEGNPKELWKVPVGTGFSAVSVSKGRVYTIGNANKTDTVFCLDAETGKEIWKYSYPCDESGDFYGPASTPTVDGKYLYIFSRKSDLFCFDSATGKVIWSKNIQNDFGAKPPEWRFSSSPLVLDEMLIVDADFTIALNKLTGELIWKTQSYEGGYSSPYMFYQDKSQRLAVYNSMGLVILDPNTGTELGRQLWELSTKINVATPIISDGKAFISAGYDKGCALVDISTDKLSIIWQNKDMRNQFGSCVLWKGYLYGFDDSEELRCMDFLTGVVKWKQKGMNRGALMIADGKLIIISQQGELIIAEASPESFKQISRVKVLDGLCWTVPVLSNGRIYCRNQEGTLVCLDVRDKTG
jgi:outer membrane protein assembly factor BamB